MSAFRRGEAGLVQNEKKKEIRLSGAETKDLAECNPEVLDAKIDDLISISDLNEASMLHNLRIRFRDDAIYTYVSSILVALNPFKPLPLYTSSVTDMYKAGPHDKPPHAYAIGYNAYNGMLLDNLNQSVVISGESGAGKTETTKVILQFLTDLSTHSGQESTVGNQILATNPILEAFGNAKTLRNNNSSRFGKLITVKFSPNGIITGGGIINYLLEKTRVVAQAKGERNYHIFYQIISAAESDSDLQEELGLQNPEAYPYTGLSGVTTVEGISDEGDFNEMMDALTTVDFSEEERKSILSFVSGVLHCGNLTYGSQARANEEDAATIGSQEPFELVARLWGVEQSALSSALLTKNIGSGKTAISTYYTPVQAAAARDAMVQRVYSELFQFVVNKINVALTAGSSPDSQFIGVLDIFGFESFVTNSFEQLCINFCNEKLQFHFNEHIFRLEQALYEAEGVNISATDFKDNKPTLEYLEARPVGVFSLCDDELMIGGATDEKLLRKIFQNHDKHPNCMKPKPKDKILNSQNCFGVLHYAGPVFYDVSGFLEKNRDQLHVDITDMLKSSANPVMQKMFSLVAPTGAASGRRGSANSVKTLGGQFKNQLNELLATLNTTQPHFVRCIKSNDLKQGNNFNSGRIQEQLSNAGLLEVCRIRKLGFPDRREFSVFYKRYRCCFPNAGDIDELLKVFTDKGILEAGEWQKGHSKIFMRTDQSRRLEVCREAVFITVVVSVQSAGRAILTRLKYRRWLKLLVTLQETMDARDGPALKEALALCGDLPWSGGHIKVVSTARVVYGRLKEETHVIEMIQTAMAGRDVTTLQTALALASKFTPPINHPLVANGEALFQKWQLDGELKAGLVKAMGAKDAATMDQFLKKAAEGGLECEEVKQAVLLLTRMRDEDAAMVALRAAIAGRQLTALGDCLSKCAMLGLENADVVAGRELQVKFEVESRSLMAVVAATEARDISAIVEALARATQAGLSAANPEVAAAVALKRSLEMQKTVADDLTAAMETRSLTSLDTAIAAAASMGMTEESSDSLSAAMKLRETLQGQGRIKEALQTALATNDEKQLNDALNEAGRIGYKGPDVDAAYEAARKFGVRNVIRDKLASAAAGDSIDEIDAALETAQSNGLLNTPEAASCLSKRTRLTEMRHLVKELVRMTAECAPKDAHTLVRWITDCERVNLQEAYPKQVEDAKTRVKFMEEEKEMVKAMERAFSADDVDALSALIEDAKAKGFTKTMQDGGAQRDMLVQRVLILTSIDDAMASKDKVRVATLLEKADQLNIKGDKVRQARLFADREQLVAKTIILLRIAQRNWDMKLLNEALEQAIELGLRSHEVTMAEQIRAADLAVQQVTSKLNSAVQLLSLKAPSGLQGADLQALVEAVEEANHLAQLPSDFKPLREADDALNLYRGHVSARRSLQNALGLKNPAAILAALGDAENLKLEIAEVGIAKTYMKNAGLSHTASARHLVSTDLGDDEAKAQRELLLKECRGARYDLVNFEGLRSGDDYSKGILFNRSKIVEGMLVFQKDAINKSLCDLNKDLGKVALNMNKNLLGYMGEKRMAYPSTLAQDILKTGFDSENMRDELYAQLIKQLSNNPKPDSISKGWQLMCLYCSTFAPSDAFSKFVVHFIVGKLDSAKDGPVVDYAKYCLRTLEGMLASGSGRCSDVPSEEEIQAYGIRPPTIVTIELVDEQVIVEDLPVTPDLSVGNILEMICEWKSLTDPRMASLGLFVQDMGAVKGSGADGRPGMARRTTSVRAFNEDLPWSARPLGKNEFIGDVKLQKAKQNREYKIVLKKKIFLPSHCVRGFHDLIDPYYERMVFVQAEDDFNRTGNLTPESEEQAAYLAACSLVLAFGEDTPNSLEGLINNSVNEFVPAAYRERQSLGDWGRKILKIRNSPLILDMSEEDLQWEYIKIAQDNPLYGIHWFHVHKLSDSVVFMQSFPYNLLVGFNYSGMHIFDAAKTLLHVVSYADLVRWGGSSSQLSVIVPDPTDFANKIELVFGTSQSTDMVAIIADQIDAIVNQDAVNEAK
jgi:myosin heavy subunit